MNLNVFSRRADEIVAHCPTDDFDFRPQYTNGRCPLCGWRPEGKRIDPPRLAHVDWFWPALIMMLALSVLMAILVFVAYARA